MHNVHYPLRDTHVILIIPKFQIIPFKSVFLGCHLSRLMDYQFIYSDYLSARDTVFHVRNCLILQRFDITCFFIIDLNIIENPSSSCMLVSFITNL